MSTKEIELLKINESAKQNAYAAIYNLHSRDIDFSGKQPNEALLLEIVSKRLGEPFRKSDESEDYIGQSSAG